MMFVGSVIFSALSYFLNGFIVLYMWSWFVVPIFPGVPKLMIAQAIGLNIIVSFMTKRIDFRKVVKEAEEDEDHYHMRFKTWFSSTFYSLLVFGVAWIVSLMV